MFQVSGRTGNRVCIARGSADSLDNRRVCLKMLDDLELLDGHKGRDNFDVVDRS